MKEIKSPIIFDEGSKEYILTALNMEVDPNSNLIIDSSTKKPVLTSQGETCTLSEFAGVHNKQLIKNDLTYLLPLADELKRDGFFDKDPNDKDDKDDLPTEEK
jgi:hypothetical protein